MRLLRLPGPLAGLPEGVAEGVAEGIVARLLMVVRRS